MRITSGVRLCHSKPLFRRFKRQLENIRFELEGEASELETGVKDSIATQTCELSKKEFNDFLTLHPIPSEYYVILPKSNQTIFDALHGYAGLYTHSFSLANLRLPLTEFFCEVHEYFQVHISMLNTFVMPSSPLLCSARLMVVSPLSTSSKGSSICVKLGWHQRFFYVQDSIIPAKYSQHLSEKNKLDSKSFKDKLPPKIEENPMFQRLGRYLMGVHVFPDPILFLAGLKPSWEYGQQRLVIMTGDKGIYLSCFFLHFPFSLIYDLLFLLEEMDFRNFIYIEDDEELSFFSQGTFLGFDTGFPSVLVNMEPLKVDEELVIQPIEVTAYSRESPKPEVFVVHPGNVAARIKDNKCKARGGSSRPPVKRKLAPGSSTSRATCLPDNHLDNHMDVELLDLHDRCYPRQAVVDNAVNRRSRELLQVIEKLRGEFDVMKDMEWDRG
ncbi:hypothetical protein Tco_1237180 [Tanacetum coccineum]